MNIWVFQLISSVLCLAALGVNVQQAAKWNRFRRELKKSLRPVCKVLKEHDGEVQIGFMLMPPKAGTVLYMLDEPPAKPPSPKVLPA